MKKEEIIKCLEKNIILYDKNLNNKEFLVLAKSFNNLISFKLSFSEINFLHLTGLKTKMNASDFYKAVINKQLNKNSFDCKYNNSLTEKKLFALPYLTEIHKLAKNIGDYNNNGFNLKTDKILGNTFISVGFVYVGKKNEYLRPNSLLQSDSRTLIQKPILPIVAIISKHRNDKTFSEITYKSKNINIDKLHFPKEIKELLTEKALYELKPSLAPQEQSLEKAPETASKALGKANNKIIESIAFAEVLSPTSTIEIPSQNKTLSEAAITKEKTPQKNTLTNRLAQSKEKAEEQNHQNKKQQNIDNLEH